MTQIQMDFLNRAFFVPSYKFKRALKREREGMRRAINLLASGYLSKKLMADRGSVARKYIRCWDKDIHTNNYLFTFHYIDSVRKRPSQRLQTSRSDVYVNRKTDFAAQLARCQKLLDSRFTFIATFIVELHCITA